MERVASHARQVSGRCPCEVRDVENINRGSNVSFCGSRKADFLAVRAHSRPVAADANPDCEGCQLVADVVNSTQAAHWPSRCRVDCPVAARPTAARLAYPVVRLPTPFYRCSHGERQKSRAEAQRTARPIPAARAPRPTSGAHVGLPGKCRAIQQAQLLL